MMNAKEIANIWKEVVKIYNNTRENNLPEKTMEEIIRKFGLEKTKEVFATVAAIKKHDGRIYGKNREYMNSIPVDSEIVEWRSGNPVVYAGLDDIHTTHINQLIPSVVMDAYGLGKSIYNVEVLDENRFFIRKPKLYDLS